MKTLAFIPARAGSKSIQGKNTAMLYGRPLILWTLKKCLESSHIDDVVVSTNCPLVKDVCRNISDVTIDNRPEHLCTDDSPVADALHEYLSREGTDDYDVIMLAQPTSPFIRYIDIHKVAIMMENTYFNTAQTVTEVPHNMHALNQRVITGGSCTFTHPDIRKGMYNKQLKDTRYKFGNLVAVRRNTFMKSRDFWETPSAPIKIGQPYDMDIDTMYDLTIANLIAKNLYLEE